ncbi:MAG TPA: hypothetical protein PK864_06370 [Syntrophorhabdaceae bacterium]|nr:hypothetical protein [Syntrophorhabdaceae bacterium]
MKVRTSLTENNSLSHEKASIKGFLPKGDTTKTPIALTVSSHSEREGESLKALPLEGATLAPVIAMLQMANNVRR